MGTLDEAIARLANLPPRKRAQAVEMVSATLTSRGQRWVPNPGPQTDAYFSKADVLLYGGEPGGGKTALAIGLAFNAHKRTLFLRRQYTDLSGAIDYAIKVNGGRNGFSGAPPPRLTIGSEHFIDFGAAARIGDEQHWMGRPHDLIVPDEGTQFMLPQITFLMGWLRHENPKQRCRVVIPTNPPLSTDGLWVIEMFAPWIDPRFANPATPGELRWAITNADGKMQWVGGPDEVHIVGGRETRPLSYTYIPSSVEDNPFYADGDYRQRLANLGEPHRSLLLGGFRTSFRDQPNQVIPTVWVQEAQKRWTREPPKDVPMCSIGVDCSGGGTDPMVLARRWDGWYAPMIEVPAKSIPMDHSGQHCAGIVVSYRSHDALVVVDLGGGYGGPTYEHLKANRVETTGYKGAEGTTRRSRDGKMHFRNKRAAALWTFREALDPGQPGGSPIALPDDPELMSDLCAPTFKPTPNGIEVESKEDVCKRLGRSTNRGDAVIMAWFEGPRETTAALEWMERAEKNHRRYGNFKVMGGSRQPLTAQRRV